MAGVWVQATVNSKLHQRVGAPITVRDHGFRGSVDIFFELAIGVDVMKGVAVVKIERELIIK